MKKFILCVGVLSGSTFVSSAQQAIQNVQHHVVNTQDITNDGLTSQKVLLHGNITPMVKVTNIQTKLVTEVPAGAKLSNSFEPNVWTGTERKKQYAIISVPVFIKQHGQILELLSYDLDITEYTNNDNAPVAQKPTGVDNSILATGTWYKIGVPSRGVYKITYSFLQSLGINPADINPANFRVYGNGGTVLPEKVTDDQPDDLIENSIYVSSTGSTFGPNDYVLFYANGPVLWTNDTTNQSFTATPNYYENQSYYFLNFNLGAGKRILTETATGTADYQVATVSDYTYINNDSFNLGNIGKAWYGNKMNTVNSASLTQSFPLNLGTVVGTVKAYSGVASVCDQYSTISVKVNNGVTVNSYSLTPKPASDPASDDEGAYTFTAPSGSFNLQYTYSTSGTGIGYIDYIQLNYKKQLAFQDGEMTFRDWATFLLPSGQTAGYTIQNATTNMKVWEISDPLHPVALDGTFAGSNYTIVRPGHTLREFVAFDGTNYKTPVKLGVSLVPNQDLHGLAQTDFLIIAPEAFMSAANTLAEFHRQKDGMNVTVVQLDKIYNEFSSGGQDIGGIRNFIRMFYARSTSQSDMIKNVLFMGAASFDYKDRLSFNTNFVPTFETPESISISSSNCYASDDFYALLDAGENIIDGNSLNDIGIGRIPAFDATEAGDAVEKIKSYFAKTSYGPWKNIISYAADNRDDNGGMNHMRECESMTERLHLVDPLFNVNKIYSDAYPIVATPSGGRYPIVNKTINDQIYNGTFMMTYSGHGNPDRWAVEAILTEDDYGHWTNKDKLPVMITATCDFGRFDDPTHRSAGAKLTINGNGGSIAMITTTQAVYQSQNTDLSTAYVDKQFTKDDNGNWRTIGEALREAKNIYPSVNAKKYVILGDPALQMAMPVYKVKTSKLVLANNGLNVETDTIKALGKYLLSGTINDDNGNVVTDFNGPVYVTIYDKVKKIQVVNPAQNDGGAISTPYFDLQTNIVAKVKGTVVNGEFTTSFVAPKDINYTYGLGKISYYANTDNTDAAGLDTTFVIGDYYRDAADDNTPPVVKPYIDNNKFRDGGATGPNPLLYVELFDENGINVSGNSIGHDLVAILDGDVQNPYVMNSYYETIQNDFSNGYVNFPMYNLPEGKHTLRVIGWDVYNNSGEGTVTFVVVNKDKGFISDLYNYPNPVTEGTTFVFQHNQEGEQLDVNILIYTANGRLVKTITQNLTTEGNRTEIKWDGLGDHGVPLQKGVYFYKLNAKTSAGVSATAYQKFVMLR